MGFISTGQTQNITAYLTQKGREILLKGDRNRFKIVYFILGDSDMNYLVEQPLAPGNVPDVTGNGGLCIPSISDSVDIINKISRD